MKLYFLKQKSLDMLEQGISDNLNKYQDAETWVDQYFIDNDKPGYFFDTGIEVDDYQLILGGPETDFLNAKILYEALQGHINLVQASDLRLWAYMAHKQHYAMYSTLKKCELEEGSSIIKVFPGVEFWGENGGTEIK